MKQMFLKLKRTIEAKDTSYWDLADHADWPAGLPGIFVFQP